MKGKKTNSVVEYTFVLTMTEQEHTNLLYVARNPQSVAEAVMEEIGISATEKDRLIHILESFDDALGAK